MHHYIIPDELHLLSRITDRNLINAAMTHDEKEGQESKIPWRDL